MRVLTVLIAAGLLAGFWSLTQPDELPPGHSVDMSVGGAELTSLEASVDLSGTSRAAITGRAVLRCAIGSRATLSLSSSGTSDLSIDVKGADARALSLTNSLLCGQERVVVDFDGSVARQQIEFSLGSNRTFFDVSLRGHLLRQQRSDSGAAYCAARPVLPLREHLRPRSARRGSHQHHMVGEGSKYKPPPLPFSTMSAWPQIAWPT